MTRVGTVAAILALCISAFVAFDVWRGSVRVNQELEGLRSARMEYINRQLPIPGDTSFVLLRQWDPFHGCWMDSVKRRVGNELLPPFPADTTVPLPVME